MTSVVVPARSMRTNAFGASRPSRAVVLAAARDVHRAQGQVEREDEAARPGALQQRAPGDRRGATIDDGAHACPFGAAAACLMASADPPVRAAPADVAGHGPIDVRVARSRRTLQQRTGRHDLARLTIAALHDLEVEPRTLDPRSCIGLADRLDRVMALPSSALTVQDAGASGLAVDVHGARAALPQAAAELRAAHVEHVAQDPQQRHVVRHVNRSQRAVDPQRSRLGHGTSPSAPSHGSHATPALARRHRTESARRHAA
jgi:hypothetical protein